MYEHLIYEEKGHIATVAIHNPKSLNALNIATLKELSQCVDHIEQNKNVRVVIITGSGDKSFVAGADISEMVDLTPEQGRGMATLADEVFLRLEKMPAVTIAAVNGYALGGGCELAMACDIRVAAQNAIFGQPECGLGTLPGFGGTQRLARLVGMGRAKELIFTCERIDAQEAYRIGLVNKIATAEELIPDCITMANKILSKGSYAVSLAKECIETGMDTDLGSGLKLEAVNFGLSFATKDKVEGMRAFLEKRKANFD